MEKKAAVKVVGVGDETKIIDIALQPGTTTRDVLQQCGLMGFELLRDTTSIPFSEHQNLYEVLDDGEKIFASSKMQAGVRSASPFSQR